MVSGLNHITIAVSDLERSLTFYRVFLGFKEHVKWDKGAYLSAGGLWLCLSYDSPSPSQDYSHIAFGIDGSEFKALSDMLKRKGVKEWKINKSEGESLYILDPDGHKLELHIGGLASRLESLKSKLYSGMVWL